MAATGQRNVSIVGAALWPRLVAATCGHDHPGRRDSYTTISLSLFSSSRTTPRICSMRVGRTTPGSKALRVGRVSEANRAYLVTFVTDGRVRRFEDLYLARIVCRALNQTRRQGTLCYVVMPDHVHWLIILNEGVSLSRVVQFAKAYSAHHINKRLARRGRVWQAGFHDHALRRAEDLVQVARYVVANPVRAGLCDSIAAYPHWDAVWI